MRFTNTEDGFKAIDADVSANVQQASVPSSAGAPLRHADPATRARLISTIEQAMSGTLDRPVGQDMIVEKLNETHVQIVLERAVTNKTYEELGTQYGLHPMYVGLICRHPFAQRIIAEVTGAFADKIDDVADRFARTAAEAAEVKIALMRTTKNDMLKDRIASDILDRAGYGARQSVDVNNTTTHTVRLERAEEGELAAVLREAMCVQTIDYTTHLRPRGSVGDEGSEGDPRSVRRSTDAELLLGTGHSEAADRSQASPVRTPGAEAAA